MLGTTSPGVLQSAEDGTLARMIASSRPGEANDAEAELYRRFAPRVRLFGLKHLRDEGEAQDLAQQVLLVTIERLRAASVRDPDRIASFILGTSRMMTQAQRRNEQRRSELRTEFAHLAAVCAPPADEALDASRLERCLRALRERERTILILTFYAEQPAGGIADALDMSPGTVRVARHRALARMRDCMEASGA